MANLLTRNVLISRICDLWVREGDVVVLHTV